MLIRKRKQFFHYDVILRCTAWLITSFFAIFRNLENASCWMPVTCVSWCRIIDFLFVFYKAVFCLSKKVTQKKTKFRQWNAYVIWYCIFIFRAIYEVCLKSNGTVYVARKTSSLRKEHCFLWCHNVLWFRKPNFSILYNYILFCTFFCKALFL